MIIVVGYQTYQLRLYGWVRVEKKKKKKKTVIYFLWLEVRKRRERGRRRSNDEASLLFSPSLIIQYVESIYNPVG